MNGEGMFCTLAYKHLLQSSLFVPCKGGHSDNFVN